MKFAGFVIMFTVALVLLSATSDEVLDRDKLLNEITEIEDMTNDLYVEMLERAHEQNAGMAISDQARYALRARINRAVVAHYYNK